MKLELKHLAPYLPCGLKILRPDNKTIVEMRGVDGNLFIFQQIGNSTESYGCIKVGNKPILRPLLDLTKEITVNSEKLVPIVELLKIKHKGWVIEKINTRYEEIEFEINHNYAKAYFTFMATLSIEVWLNNVKSNDYWIVEKLFEWNFDVNSLIDKGLAIDINTLENA